MSKSPSLLDLSFNMSTLSHMNGETKFRFISNKYEKYEL